MPKGIRKDGTKAVPPIRQQTGKVKKGPYWFDADIVAVLSSQPNATAYIQELIREKQ